MTAPTPDAPESRLPSKPNLRLVVAALRSGEFEQGRGALVTVRPDGTRRHYCLGVATEVARRHGVELWVDPVPTAVSYDCYLGYRDHPEGFAYTTVLPARVRAWLGLHASDPVLNGHVASAWNDGVDAGLNREYVEPVGFDEIADLFEREFDLTTAD